jgi:zinc protease
METLDRSDAQTFYDRWYTPNNAIVIVAGDVTEDEVRKLAEETYGKLPRRFDPPPRGRLKEPPPEAARVVTLADPRVTQPSVSRLYLAPSRVSGDAAEAAALDLLADILGGGTTSRLYRQLVVEQGIAAAAGAGYDTGRMGESTFSVGGSPRGDTTPEALAAAFDKVIADLIANGVTDDELASARERVRASAIYAEDNPTALARVIGEALATGLTLQQAQEWPSVLATVTKEDVVAVARKYLEPRRSVTGYLVNAPAEGRS